MIKESRRMSYNTLSSFFHKDDSFDEGKLKRAFELRKTMSDTEIGQHYGNLHGGGKPFDQKIVTSFFDKFKEHPNYVGPAFPGRKHNEEDFKKTVVGLSQKGHSASSIADFLHSDERPVSKNKVIGVLSRTPNEEKQKIKKEIESGNEPEEYIKHKDKPVVKKLEGKAGWKNISKLKEKVDIKMDKILLESRIKKIMGMFSRRQTGADRVEHARHAYKIVNQTVEKLKKQLEGAHPDVKQILEYLERHHTSALNMLNKMGAGEDPMKPKKSKEQERM